MQSKQDKRIRRSRQTRARIAVQRVARLSVYRSNSHIYASLISDDGSRILATASTVQKSVIESLEKPGGSTVSAAQAVGKRIAELAKTAGVERVAFDRSGFAYHGRVKALAEAAREAGLQF
jgi:large subunit ribosomal protein L18